MVKIYKTTIRGMDLHILKGDLPEVTDGRILRHQGIVVIKEVGSAVTNKQVFSLTENKAVYRM